MWAKMMTILRGGDLTINRQGSTRIVFLSKNYAFKLPNVCNYRLMLHGLLANMQENTFSKADFAGLCPVIFYVWGGWLVVMPRARVMTCEEFLSFNAEDFCNRETYVLPVEHKFNSFGYLNNEIVAIDYGS